ncbi:hypothetical protein [Mycobacterium marseillense]|uniref:Uncharacterized protein n=1 Tax=Mycobacterium marseillense TaxID=701042 RepID=A0ABM7JIH8_9MYCO|nr:hypothetical protein [Mycobacterium marseillense]MCV7406480.1 hypothetical protein [Mycobacterium marseillense]ORA93585.1 hypothetical protein BST31_11125 [Mycobacterium marseillense]BBY13759.1 hypothetical protein MMARJ_44990 [Mycobacterium marseillense]
MPATLSQIRAWSTEHLTNAASYWTKTADEWEDVFLTMRNQSYAVAWQGAGGDALRQRTSTDLPVVNGKADQLRQAAGVARNGASDISAAQRRVMYAVEDAENAGFTVGEDLSVSYTENGGTPAERAARQALAERMASEIWSRAGQLEGVEVKVAGQLTAVADSVVDGGFKNPNGGQYSATNGGQNGQGSSKGDRNGHVTPAANGQRGGVQLVDFKQDGGAGPAPPMPQPTPSQGQPQIGPFPVPPQVAAAAPKTPPPTAPPVPAPAPPAPAGPSFGQCVGQEVKANVGKDMIKSGFESGIKTAIKGVIGGAVGGAAVTPEALGAGAIPGALGGGVLGFVGGFAKGLLEAPVKAGVKGAWDCAK